jgi:DNA-binding NarL/FixJ family response regulator
MGSSSTAASDAIRVLVADSNRMQAQLLAGALRRRTELHIATCRMDTTSLLHGVASGAPRIVLLSLNSSANAHEGLTTLRRFHLSHPEVFKILLVESIDRELVVSAFRSGARGIFRVPEADLRVLCKCIQRVASGQIWADTEQLNYLFDLITEVPSLRVVSSEGRNMLTPREEQVVALVAEGLSNGEIAQELALSRHTIKKYLFRIFDKLGISTRVELVLYAVNHGDPRRAEWLAGMGRTAPPD